MSNPKYGYDINTGEPIYLPEHKMVHQGNGFYARACDITKEDLERRQKFFASLDREVNFILRGVWDE